MLVRQPGVYRHRCWRALALLENTVGPRLAHADIISIELIALCVTMSHIRAYSTDYEYRVSQMRVNLRRMISTGYIGQV